MYDIGEQRGSGRGRGLVLRQRLRGRGGNHARQQHVQAAPERIAHGLGYPGRRVRRVRHGAARRRHSGAAATAQSCPR